MGRRFEELDRRRTPMGEVSLRRQLDPTVAYVALPRAVNSLHIIHIDPIPIPTT